MAKKKRPVLPPSRTRRTPKKGVGKRKRVEKKPPAADLKADQREVERRFAEERKGLSIPIEAMEGSDAQKARALVKFRELGTVRAACEAAHCGRRTWYDWIDSDPAFARAVAEAKEDVADELEEEAATRAKDGSDLLIIFLLKALRPGKYRDLLKITEVSPVVREKLRQTVDIIRSELTKEVSDQLLKRLDGVWGG